MEVPSIAYKFVLAIILLAHIELSTATICTRVSASTTCRSHTFLTLLKWRLVEVPSLTYNFVLAIILIVHIDLSSATICTRVSAATSCRSDTVLTFLIWGIVVVPQLANNLGLGRCGSSCLTIILIGYIKFSNTAIGARVGPTTTGRSNTFCACFIR
jgi:hypothetical protein